MNRKPNTSNEDSIAVNSDNIGLNKEWLSYDDICFLYGKTSKKGAYETRMKKEITVSKHPLNNKKYIYLKADIEEKISKNTILRKNTTGQIIDFEENSHVNI